MQRILKPNLWKIVLTGILFFVSSVLWRAYVTSHISDTFPHGFPFQFYLGWGPCQRGEICYEFNGLFLIFDILIWYFVSAFITDRISKSRQSK